MAVVVFVSMCVLALLNTIQRVSQKCLFKCIVAMVNRRTVKDSNGRCLGRMTLTLFDIILLFDKNTFQNDVLQKRICEDSYGLLLNTLMFCRDIIVSSEKYFSDCCTEGRVRLAMVFFSRL